MKISQKLRSMALVAGLALSAVSTAVFAQQSAPQSRTAEIRLAAGTTSVIRNGVIRGYGDISYLIALREGESFSVRMKTSNASSYFNVTAPGATEALHIGSSAGNEMSAKAGTAGAYKVTVYLMRNAARRNERARFALNIDLPDRKSARAGGDFADGLAGGPDFWRIEGRGRINVRSEPRARAARVARVSSGDIVRNRGCRMNGSARWCQIESLDGATRGWIAGRFLREGSDPSQNARPGDALVKGTNYHATGNIPCMLKDAPDARQCDFGVTRGAKGVGTVFITLAGKTIRVLSFSDGKVASQSAASSVEFVRDGENTRVTINGGEESYTIPGAVISGG